MDTRDGMKQLDASIENTFGQAQKDGSQNILRDVQPVNKIRI
jgi:hypothetical protein